MNKAKPCLKQRSLFGIVVLLILYSNTSFAHFPLLQCQLSENDKKILSCKAGFSDGSLSGEVELNVYDYSDKLLKAYSTDTEGQVNITLPAGEFYIVFDPDHEVPAEFDSAELD